MKLLTHSIGEQLLRNGRLQQDRAEAGGSDADFIPVVKLFTPDAGCTWLLTELDPDDSDIAFGLCDLGAAVPSLAVSVSRKLNPFVDALGFPPSVIFTSKPARPSALTPTRRALPVTSQHDP